MYNIKKKKIGNTFPHNENRFKFNSLECNHPSQIVVHIEGNSSKGGPEPTKREGLKKRKKKNKHQSRESQ